MGRDAVLAAVEATRGVVTTNTNLGIDAVAGPLGGRAHGRRARHGVETVLAATTIDDARDVYRAIQLAQPGGLGEVADQDIRDEPTITLREVMALAADRDLIARQYVNGFREVLDEALPSAARVAQRWSITRNRDRRPPLCVLLARHPDSLIARKFGLSSSGRRLSAGGRVAASRLARSRPDTPRL